MTAGSRGPVTRVRSRRVVRLFPARRPSCLLVQAREDPDAFAAFYDAYAERVLIFFTRRVLDVDAAFDLLSETFATALEQRGQFRGATAERGAGLAVRDRPLGALALLARRPGRAHGARAARRARAGAHATRRSSGSRSWPGSPVLAASSPTRCGTLPEDQRRAVELRVVEEYGYDEVAGRCSA